jgi:hypothetical protein
VVLEVENDYEVEEIVQEEVIETALSDSKSITNEEIFDDDDEDEEEYEPSKLELWFKEFFATNLLAKIG